MDYKMWDPYKIWAAQWHEQGVKICLVEIMGAVHPFRLWMLEKVLFMRSKLPATNHCWFWRGGARPPLPSSTPPSPPPWCTRSRSWPPQRRPSPAASCPSSSRGSPERPATTAPATWRTEYPVTGQVSPSMIGFHVFFQFWFLSQSFTTFITSKLSVSQAGLMTGHENFNHGGHPVGLVALSIWPGNHGSTTNEPHMRLHHRKIDFHRFLFQRHARHWARLWQNQEIFHWWRLVDFSLVVMRANFTLMSGAARVADRLSFWRWWDKLYLKPRKLLMMQHQVCTHTGV